MPPAAKSSPKGKVAGLPWWGWVAVAGGIGVTYYLYRRYEDDVASATTTNGSTSTDAGDTSSDTTVPASTGTGIQTQYADFATWQGAALAAMTAIKPAPGEKGTSYISTTEALNALTSWLNGSCVDQRGANAIGAALQHVGLPPGYSTVPPISVCASTPGTTTTHTRSETPTASTATTAVKRSTGVKVNTPLHPTKAKVVRGTPIKRPPTKPTRAQVLAAFRAHSPIKLKG